MKNVTWALPPPQHEYFTFTKQLRRKTGHWSWGYGSMKKVGLKRECIILGDSYIMTSNLICITIFHRISFVNSEHERHHISFLKLVAGSLKHSTIAIFGQGGYKAKIFFYAPRQLMVALQLDSIVCAFVLLVNPFKNPRSVPGKYPNFNPG